MSKVSGKIGQGMKFEGNYAADYFYGAIDDVRVYSCALSAAEIQQLYKMGK